MSHCFITVAIPFDTGRADAVDQVLSRMGNPPTAALRQVLDATGIVHFMSLTAVRDTAPGRAHLVLEASADLGAADPLAAIAAALAPELEDTLDAAGLDTGDRSLPAFLAQFTLSVGAGWGRTAGLAFDGSPGLSVGRIRAEAALASRILTEMGGVLSAPMPARDKLQAVRTWLWEAGEKWAFVAQPTPFLFGGITRTPLVVARLAATVFVQLGWPFAWVPVLLMVLFGFWPGVLTTLVVLLAAAGLGLAMLRRLETANTPEDAAPDAARLAAVEQHESHGAQNLLAARSTMQAGAFRRLTLRIAFGMVTQGAARVYRPGYLRAIGVIHFARWVKLPGTDTLLFYSNFSDTWESYLEDFISKAADGLTAVWSNTRGFPATRLLFGGGAADGDRFRRWARRQQMPALFWYSAYPALKVPRIRLNAAICRGIATARTDAEAEDWLTCFGSAPRPAFALEKAEIQTLVFGALKRLRHSASLMLRFSGPPAQAGAWLRQVAPRITYGEHTTPHGAMVLAFTATGLARLGLAAADLATFPVAFQHGMSAPWRARMLGDAGDQAPETWAWGTDTDAMVTVFADDDAGLQAQISRLTAEAAAFGHTVAFQQVLKPLPEEGQVFEPFGFADGISQPVLRDTPRARVARNAAHVVDAGEFVLGYPDSRGYRPPSPTVGPGRDAARLLPEFVDDPHGLRDPYSSGGSGARDLGRNGSFVVVRQLEQDVAGFNAWLDAQAGALAGADPWALPKAELTELLAAKVMGRWRSGASLVRHPHPPRKVHEPDNDFGFAREDPQGLRCPLGAHMRRANPRDSLDTDGAEQQAIVNRHRLMRVGRQYEAPPGGKPGLMFTCLNADIERQFEFVQQTWLLGDSFHGLLGETDPALGSGDRGFTIPTRQGPMRLTGLKDFVRMRGGAYFFMPSRSAVAYLVACAT